MLLEGLAKEWHKAPTGLLSDLSDFWEIPPTFQQKGVPKKLLPIGDYSHGLSKVTKHRLGHKHTIFSKRSPHLSATINQFIVSQFAHHLDFPLAPLLMGPNTHDIHSLRMVFNVKSGSLFEVLLDKIKKADPDVPQKVLDCYQASLDDNKKYPHLKRAFQQYHVASLLKGNPDIKEWYDGHVDPVYCANKETISRWVAFMALVDDSEKISNIGNLIVSMNNPKEILYFIDSHPNLQPGVVNYLWYPEGKDVVVNNGRYFRKDDEAKGNVDYEIISQELESFKNNLSPDLIDEVIFKAATLMGRLEGNNKHSEDPKYFRQLRDFYRNRSQTLECQF